MPATIGYLDGPRLRRSLLAAAQWVALSRDELNRINVFPVPDGDTGTNFSLTMKSIAEALQRIGDAPLHEVSRATAQAAVMGSRGNSGMMLAHFLVGFDTRSRRFLESRAVPSGGGTVRHMFFDPRTQVIWFGSDAGTIGRANLPPASAVP